jgi:hypothetical protein
MFDECRSQVQSYMFWVKCCGRINIGINDYMIEDLWVIKSGMIIVNDS